MRDERLKPGRRVPARGHLRRHLPGRGHPTPARQEVQEEEEGEEEGILRREVQEEEQEEEARESRRRSAVPLPSSAIPTAARTIAPKPVAGRLVLEPAAPDEATASASLVPDEEAP